MHQSDDEATRSCAAAEREAAVAKAVDTILEVTAEASLFDTEPSGLQATLISLAKPADESDG